MQKNAPVAIDLFCGAGGLTVGLKKAGFKVLAGIEILGVAAETYKLNHKTVSVYEKDIKDICPYRLMDELGLKRGQLDLLAGCPPCQGFSTHRTRKKAISTTDERNELIFRFLDFVKAFYPKTIMMENVPALIKDERMTVFSEELNSLGYNFSNESLKIEDASDFGVPQRRKRMILQVSRLAVLETARPKKSKRTVYQAIGKLAKVGDSGDLLHDLGEKRSQRVRELIKLIPKNGGSRVDLPKEYWLPCHVKNPGSYSDVFGRMSWQKVSPTITGGCHNPSKGRFLHPEEDRNITLREAALLQTFPKKYKFSLRNGKEAVALMIGNALPPKFIENHANAFIRHLAMWG